MTNIMRNIFTAITFSPLILLIYLTSLFIGKRKAIERWGIFVTFLAKHGLRLWLPEIQNPNEFDKFKTKMKSRTWIWRPFLGFKIAKETDDLIKLNVQNCPYCEVLNAAGLSDLSPYVCQGDWVKAKENKNKWLFEREHQIGTGDSFCDHTYLRKK